MKRLYYSVLPAIFGLFVLTSPASAKTESKGHPFHGKLQAVDTSAETITVAGKNPHTYHLTAETKITDGAGNLSTLSAAVVGEDCGGYVLKEPADTLKSVRFGAKTGSKTAAAAAAAPAAAAAAPMAAAPAAPAPAAVMPAAAAPAAMADAPAAAPEKLKKQRFSGKVVSVSGSTVVVHGKADQTFTAANDTKFTGATSLADLTAGEKVSGTYTKAADGAMMLATIKASK